MRKIFKSLSLIINYKTFIITTLSILSTYFCFHMGFTAKFPDMLVGVAIVFPVVFSIGAAYTRRETALQRLSDFKGHAIALFYAIRDWTSNKENELPGKAKILIGQIFLLMKEMYQTKADSNWHQNELKMYSYFSDLSLLTMELRNFGVQSGEVSRVSQYVSKMIIAFDNMKIIQHYRTPITLRSYSKFFIFAFPIVYGPYFASTFHDFSAHLEYVMPILYSFILVSLDNIQDHLENPFDDVGEDDIQIDETDALRLIG
jgi:hypothetical protein